ncbi:MAG: DsbA family protein [Alphaproteobacteria bacterium]|nr:DsbA family protein [Alphaproteobacteria bacterium]
MSLSRLIFPALLASTLVTPAMSAGTESFSPAQRSEIETIVKSYLIAHPEVIEEVITELSNRQADDDAKKHEATLTDKADAIFKSPKDAVLGNKDGDVTMVEFFDYNCGYCKRAMRDMLTLLETDPKLKVVLKEFPVLGSGSIEAAQVAVAVHMQDPTGKKYLEFHQNLLGARGASDKARAIAAAKDAGLDLVKLQKDMTSPEVMAVLKENIKLAESLGMNGTPSYVVGKHIIGGAVGLEELKEKISQSRCGKDSC